VVACSSAGTPASPSMPAIPAAATGVPAESPVTGYRIATASGDPLTAVAGDALRLVVVRAHADGTTDPLGADAKVAWSGPPLIQALAEGSDPGDGVLPQPGTAATGMFLSNPTHYSDADLLGVLWVLDPGSAPSAGLHVIATVSGVDPAGSADATIPVAPTPAGDVARGAQFYGQNCAACHGPTGHGNADFPGLNAEAGNVAGDPAWNAALIAMAARSDMDNVGVTLASAMPKWLVRPTATGKPPTTQEFADAFAFLKTQNQ
jgi:mono/diheme cytochrome c family protein